MKRFLTVIMVVLLAAGFGYASELDDLRMQIEKLEKQVKSMNSRLGNTERHAATDTLSLSAEFRTRLDSITYTDVQALPDYAQTMMGLWLTDSLAGQSDEKSVILFMDPGVAMGTPTDSSGDEVGMLIGTPVSGSSFQMDVSGMMGANDGFNDAFMENYVSDFFTVFNAAFPSLLADSNFVGDFIDNYNGMYGTAYDKTNSADVTAFMTAMGTAKAAYEGGMSPATAEGIAGYYNAAMAVMGGYLDSTTLTAAQAATIKTLFGAVTPKKYKYTNDTFFTNKLRIRMSSKVNKNLSFSGRLLMYKAFGDTSNTRFFDGTFKSMSLDGNSGAVPTDDGLHVERAYFVYKNDLGSVPMSFSFGRRPSTYGYGYDNHENAPLGGSPAAHIIQWNFDGGSLAFDLSEVAGVEGLNFKLCYGQGFESDWGTYGATTESNLEDVNFWGAILRFYDDEQYRVVYNYAKALGITDGFVANTVMPFMVSGKDNDLDGQYDEFTLSPNLGGFVSRFEPMTEIGDIELHSLLVQGENAGFNWFASYSTSKSDPTNQSKMAMMQFMGWDKLLGSDKSESGNSIWVGLMTPELPGGGKLGVEYNQGSQYWFSFTEGEDHVTQSKLATRGTATEVYYHQPVVGNNLVFTLGWLHIDNEYAGAGNPLAPAVKIDELTGMDAMMPVADVIDQYYLSMNYRF